MRKKGRKVASNEGREEGRQGRQIGEERKDKGRRGNVCDFIPMFE